MGTMGPVSFTPEAMEDVALELDVHAEVLRGVASDVGDALAAFATSSSEMVPPLPAHAPSIDTLGELVHGLSTSVLHLAEAAREADRRGLDLVAVMTAGVDLTRTADAGNSSRAAVIAMLQLGVHAARHVRASASELRLAARYGTRAMPAIEAIRREVAGGTAMSRAAIRPLQLARYRELRAARLQLTRTQQTATAAIRTIGQGSPVTRIGTRVDELMRTTTAGRRLSSAGRLLGGAGVVIGTYDTMTSAVAGDVEQTIVSGLGTAGNVMMMTGNPVLVGAGAAITVGVVVYDNWDTVTDWGESVVDFGGGIVEGVGDLVGGLF